MNTPPRRIAIIGAGISGLTAAYYLEQYQGEAHIDIFEASDRVGGKIMTEVTDTYVIERGPESVLSKKTAVMDLIESLGLATECVARKPEYNKTYIYTGGVLHRLPSGMSGLIPGDLGALEHTTLISREGLARFKAEPDIPPRSEDSDESVASFAIRRFGLEIYEKIVDPLLGGIYGGSGDTLSIRATFPQLCELEATGGVLRSLGEKSAATAKYPPFVSLRNGMEALIHALLRALARTTVYTNTPISEVVRTGDTYRLVRGDGSMTNAYDALIITTPAYVTQKIVRALDEELAALHSEIPYTSSTIVSCMYNETDIPHALDGYGYISPSTEKRPVHAVTWSSRKWPHRAPEHTVLMRAFLGGGGDPHLNHTDDEILRVVQREFETVMGVTEAPREYRIDRYGDAMPQYRVGHRERVAAIEACAALYPGLYLSGMAYHGVGIPDCIKSARTVAERITKGDTSIQQE